MGRDGLGEFEALVLLATLRLGPEAYGLSIAEEIRAIAGRSASRASVYVTLRRLEQKGLVTTRREAPGARPGQPRRLVSATPAALDQLRASRHGLLRMWQGLEGLLDVS